MADETQVADAAPAIPYELTEEYANKRLQEHRKATGAPGSEPPPPQKPGAEGLGPEWQVPGVVPPGGKMPGLPEDYKGTSQPTFVKGMPSGYISPPTGGPQYWSGSGEQGYNPLIRHAAIDANQVVTGALNIPAYAAGHAWDFANDLTSGALGPRPQWMDSDYITEKGTIPGLYPRTALEREDAMGARGVGTELPLTAGGRLQLPQASGVSPAMLPRGYAFGAGVQALRDRGYTGTADELQQWGGATLLPGPGGSWRPGWRRWAGSTAAGAGVGGGGYAISDLAGLTGERTAPSREESIVAGLRGGETAKSVLEFLHNPTGSGALGLGTMLVGLYGPQLAQRLNMIPTPQSAGRIAGGVPLGRIIGSNPFPTPMAPPSPERVALAEGRTPAAAPAAAAPSALAPGGALELNPTGTGYYDPNMLMPPGTPMPPIQSYSDADAWTGAPAPQ